MATQVAEAIGGQGHPEESSRPLRQPDRSPHMRPAHNRRVLRTQQENAPKGAFCVAVGGEGDRYK